MFPSTGPLLFTTSHTNSKSSDKPTRHSITSETFSHQHSLCIMNDGGGNKGDGDQHHSFSIASKFRRKVICLDTLCGALFNRAFLAPLQPTQSDRIKLYTYPTKNRTQPDACKSRGIHFYSYTFSLLGTRMRLKSCC